MKKVQALCGSLGILLGATAPPALAQSNVIRVEIDYMVDEFHSHQPTQAELDAVIQMFACKGITLIIDLDDAIPHANIVQCQNAGEGNFFSCTNYEFSFGTLKAEHRDQGSGWHYCIFGHQYNDGGGIDSSGLGEILGNDFFVADGVFTQNSNKPFKRASTFAHELGHNLGLRHYSSGSTSDDDYPPNLPSIMSYRYQLGGVKDQMESQGLVGNDHLFKSLDYSSGRLPTVNESTLVESRGLGIVPVDWDCSGFISGVANQNLDTANNWCLFAFGSDTLADRNEWASILDVADRGTALNDQPCDYETCARVPLDEDGADLSAAPILASEPCRTGKMIFFDVNSTSPVSETGTGTRPYRKLDALQTAPDGSVAYLSPGTYTLSTGGALVLDAPVVLAGIGGALLDP